MATQEPSPKGAQKDRLHQAKEAVEAEAEEDLARLTAERTQLEVEIRARKLRIGEIGLVLNGKKDSPGLAAKVLAARRIQTWVDLGPERAKVRATPEWQAWREQFMNRNFITDDRGVVTVDWVALSAGILLLVIMIVYAVVSVNGAVDEPAVTEDAPLSRFVLVRSKEFETTEHPLHMRYEQTVKDVTSGCLYTMLIPWHSHKGTLIIQQRNSDGSLRGCGKP